MIYFVKQKGLFHRLTLYYLSGLLGLILILCFPLNTSAADYTISANSNAQNGGAPMPITGDNNTITVNPGVTINAATGSAILFTNVTNGTATNHGTLIANEGGKTGMEFIDSSNITAINFGTINTQALNGNGVNLLNIQDSSFTNEGTITTFSGNPQFFGIYVEGSGTRIQVTNNNLITLINLCNGST